MELSVCELVVEVDCGERPRVGSRFTRRLENTGLSAAFNIVVLSPGIVSEVVISLTVLLIPLISGQNRLIYLLITVRVLQFFVLATITVLPSIFFVALTLAVKHGSIIAAFKLL